MVTLGRDPARLGIRKQKRDRKETKMNIHTHINQINSQITDLMNTAPEETAHQVEIADEIANLTAGRDRLIALARDNYEAGQDPDAIANYLADA